jgi:glycosyltransferase involved in cell wall biosynthesis
MTSDSSIADAPALWAAQARRLAHVVDFLGGEQLAGSDDKARIFSALRWLLGRLQANKRDDELWLVFTAMAGSYPSGPDIERAITARDSRTLDSFVDWFIPASAIPAVWGGSPTAQMTIVESLPVVDVSSCARSERHTGIQRVERETVPHWLDSHDFVLAAWTDREGMYRTLRPRERARVTAWGTPPDAAEPSDGDDQLELLVPWHTRIILLEVADLRRASRLTAIARYSGSSLAAVGYDAIPFTSPELLPADSGIDFLDYLEMVTTVRVVAGISRAATDEFRGYLDAAGALDGKSLETCILPVDVPTDAMAGGEAPTDSDPMILCVGSHEPRKNHGTILHAAEKLWREGHCFSLRFLGGGGWGTDFDLHAERLRKKGRNVELKKGVTDEALWDAYRAARFTVFPSLHEGYGLPVAESLAFGTPVITSNYGSTREIAQAGGCLLVDPRDDRAVFEAMRRLLIDDVLLKSLADEARSMPVRTWAEYAEDLWNVMVSHDG